MKNAKVDGKTMQLEKASYGNGLTALRIIHQGSPYIVLSTNLIDYVLMPGSIWVKNGETEEEIASQLEKQGLLSRGEQQAKSGYNTYCDWQLSF